MNLKNNKGITLLALTITVIVMLIIASITIYGGSKVIKQAQKEDVKTNMLLLQAEMKNYVEQARYENKKIENFLSDGITIGEKTLKISQADEIQGVQFYKILTPLSEFNLEQLDEELYLISIDIDKVNVNVYFVPGISDGENTYHILSEM